MVTASACARVAGLPRHYREQYGQRRELGDKPFEKANNRCRHKGGDQIDVQPGQAALYGEPGQGQGPFFRADTHHLLEVRRGDILDRVEQAPVSDHTDQVSFQINNRNRIQTRSLKKLHQFLTIGFSGYCFINRLEVTRQRLLPAREGQVLNIDTTLESALSTDHEYRACSPEGDC